MFLVVPDTFGEEYPRNLQETKLPMLSAESCNNDGYLSMLGGIDAEKQLCAGYQEGEITTCLVREKIQTHI